MKIQQGSGPAVEKDGGEQIWCPKFRMDHQARKRVSGLECLEGQPKWV